MPKLKLRDLIDINPDIKNHTKLNLLDVKKQTKIISKRFL